MKKNGFSLIELLIVITISSVLSIMAIKYKIDDLKVEKTVVFLQETESIVKGVVKRLSIDGYESSMWQNEKWKDEDDIVNKLIKEELVSLSSRTCSDGKWTPTDDAEKETSIISCGLWKERGGNGEKMSANLNFDSLGFINGFEILIKFDLERTPFKDVKYGLNKLKINIPDELVGVYDYGFYTYTEDAIGMHINTQSSIKDCLSNTDSCVIRLAYDRAGGEEYVRIDGSNSMLDSHLTFIKSRGVSPLKCLKWTNNQDDGSGVWSLNVDEECGIGIYPETGVPIAVDVVGNTGTFEQIVLDEECINYRWNGTTVIDNGTRSPCGFTNNGTEIYQTVPNTSSNISHVKNLYSDKIETDNIYSRNIIAETVTADYLDAKQKLKTDLIEAYTVNGMITVNNRMTLKDIVYAEKNFYIAGDNVVTGNISSNKSITANENITAKKSLISKEELRLMKVNTSGTNCSNNGALSRTSNGSLLTCVSGKWSGDTGVPVGTIAMWGGLVPPTDWIEMNGQSTAAYPALRAIVGNNVPDTRGQFIRAWDHGKGVDSGRGFKSFQSDATKRVKGRIVSLDRGAGTYDNISGSPYRTIGRWSAKMRSGNGDSWGTYVEFDNARVVATANEVRPKNISLMYIIKAR